jgi:hypothetical protein
MNGFGDNDGGSEQSLSKRAKQRAAALKKKPEVQKGQQKSTQGAASSTADTTGRGQPAGGSNEPLKAAGANMVWPNEGRWEVGRVGSRRARDISVEVWGERSARSRSGTISFTWNRLSASESVDMEAIIEKRLNGQIWRELYVSREFMVQNTDRTMRGVADLSHLSDHYDSIVTKAETLDGFSASLCCEKHASVSLT